MIGKTLAHYEVTSQLGKGGMGEVYQATDTKLGRQVAIKTLPEEFAQDEERLARFEREAKLLASLNHPNIATIHGLEEDSGTRFLVLELVEGDTLADRLKRGAIPVEESLKLALQIAEALEAAHEKGVIHRDLKPANIKVTPDGKIKVLDFGLAKAFSGDGSDANLSQSPTLSMAATQKGVILGTAAYMSPEQASGDSTDKRADIWSFGVVLFEMVTGRQTFDGKTVAHVLADVLRAEPEWSSLPPNLHPRLRLLLERCLEKEVKDRCHDVADARVDIQKVLADPDGVLVQPPAEPVQLAPQSKLLWVGAIIAFAMIAAVAAWNLKPEPPEEPGAVVRLSHPLGEEGFTRGGRRLVGISRDGTELAYVANGQIFLKNLNETDARPLVGTDEDASTPVFSPNGQQLGFYSVQDQELKRIPVAGGTPTRVISAEFPFDITWGDDDTITYSLLDGIWQVPSNGGTATRIVEAAEGENVFGSQLLPGGTHVLYSVWTGTVPDQAEIVVEDLETHERKTVWTGGNDARYLPTGHLVYVFDTDLFALQFDLETLNVGEDGQVSVVPGVRRANTGAHYAISDTGTLVYSPGAAGTMIDRVLAFVDRDGNIEVLPAPERVYDFTRLSPDERRIAVQIGDDDGTWNIWIYDITSNVLSQLTHDGGERPLWTRDGTWITYLNAGSLWNIPADFSGTATELAGTNVAGNEGPGSWSVDDEVLLFSSPSGIHGWTRDNNGGSVEVIVRGGRQADRVFAPQFSPDGRWFVFGAGSDRQLFALPYPVGSEGRRTITIDGGQAPIWPRRGNQLLFGVGTPLIQAIPIQTDPILERGNPVEGFVVDPSSISSNGIPKYDVTPDGTQLLASVRLRRFPATGDGDEAGDDYRRVNVILNFFEELKERLPAP